MENLEKIKDRSLFKKIESFTEGLADFKKNNYPIESPRVEGFKKDVAGEITRIKEALIDAASSIRKSHIRCAYIQFHQCEAFRIAGSLQRFASPQRLFHLGKLCSQEACAHYLFSGLQDIIVQLQTDFQNFLLQDISVPDAYRSIFRYQAEDGLTAIFTTLKAAGLHKSLHDIAYAPFHAVLGSQPASITYHHVHYLLKYKFVLQQTARQCKPKTVNRTVRILLHDLNFNSFEFFNYTVNYIQQEVESATRHAARLDKLAFFKKLLLQHKAKPGLILDYHRLPLHDLLIEWIVDEEAYYQKKIDLSGSVVSMRATTPTALSVGKRPERKPMILGMPIVRFACFLQLCYLQEVFKNRDVKDWLRLVSELFESPDQEPIGMESFRKKFGKPTSDMWLQVEQTLESWLSFVKKLRQDLDA